MFFFKQKTAYEMRISDWSSDVCSSDLVLTFGPRATAAETLFAGIVAPGDDIAADRLALFRTLGSRLPAAYASSLEAVDPNDPTNRKTLEPQTLTALIHGGFINAQRGLDDDTHRERDVPGKDVEGLLQSTLADTLD